jgi:hypothetical protein
MPNRHALRAYDYVNRPYHTVRDALLMDPMAVFRRATTAAANPELHATAGPFDVATEIDLEIIAVRAARSPSDQPATDIVIEWRAARRPRLFPTMRATLSLYALTPTETQLELAGVYDPPLGIIGDAVDAIAMSSIAAEAVAGFVRDVAAYLRTVSAERAAATA